MAESMHAGDVLFGSNQAGAANVKWDVNAGQLQFRGGTTVQAYIDTDGSIKAGGGALSLGSSGIAIATDDSWSTIREYSFYSGTNHVGGVRAFRDSSIGAHYVELWSDANPSGDFSQASITAVSGSEIASIRVEAGTSSGTGRIVFTGDRATFQCPTVLYTASSDPSPAVDGMMYVKTTDGTLQYYHGGWHTVQIF